MKRGRRVFGENGGGVVGVRRGGQSVARGGLLAARRHWKFPLWTGKSTVIGPFADDAHMLFRARSVGAIVVPRPSIAYIRSGDRGRRFGGLFGFLLGGFR